MRCWLLLFVVLLFAAPASAQVQCGVVRTLDFPVDRSRFTLMQDYAAQSYRHQGRYHTGEDWAGAPGEYVRAIADGRVTFSSANGWGRDGGVIILEHNFPDGSVAYSMYGHISDQTGVQFPAPFSCVRQGDVLAAVGDARPAPHVHVEIRTDDPSIPGAGYTWNFPADEGLRRPSKFILNWQTWLSDAYRWRLDLADETGIAAPPVALADNGLLALDSNRVIRVSDDGRLLWRINLDRRAVGLIPFADTALIAYADGRVQRVNADSTLGEAWETGIALAGAPLILPDRLIVPTPTGIAALDSGARSVLWQHDAIGAVARWIAGGDQIGVMTADGTMITLREDGTILDQARLREPGSLAFSGGLIAFTRGGAWRIDGAGAWSPLLNTSPAGGAESAAALDASGRLFLWDGETLYAYNAERFGLWQAPLPGVDGIADLTITDRAVLLTTSRGDVIAVQPESGGVCNRLRVYGDAFTRLWHSVGADGILRVHAADQIIGLDWEAFLLGCA